MRATLSSGSQPCRSLKVLLLQLASHHVFVQHAGAGIDVLEQVLHELEAVGVLELRLSHCFVPAGL